MCMGSCVFISRSKYESMDNSLVYCVAWDINTPGYSLELLVSFRASMWYTGRATNSLENANSISKSTNMI